jgi:pimeloyl-ACP methyl ester carboxylesterase
MPLRLIAGPQGRLAVDDAPGAGTEPPVVFLHCDAGSHGQWREALAHLRPARRAVAFDFRGSGRSAPAADGDYGHDGRAADIGAVLGALALDQCVLVGHSGGAITALHYAARHADRVRALLLVDPAADGRQFPEAQRRQLLEQLAGPNYRAVLRDYYTSIAGPDAATRARILQDAEATPQATVLGSFRTLSEYDPRPALADYRGRRLSLVTDLGDNPAALHRLDPTLPVRRLHTMGHWPQLDDPAGFHRILDEFLA